MGPTINNEDIREALHFAVTIQTALNKELSHVEGNKHHIEKIVPSYLKGEYSKSQKIAVEFKNNLVQTVYNSGIVLLIAAFDRVVFAKYRTAYGELKSFIEKSKELRMEYYLAKERFVNTSLNRLGELIGWLEGCIDAQLYDKFFQIKEHRNHIAHGSINGLTAPFDFTLEEIAEVLDSVITQIEIKK